MANTNIDNAVFDIVEEGWLVKMDWNKISEFKKYKEVISISEATAEDIRLNKNNIRKAVNEVFVPVKDINSKEIIKYERLM